MTKATFVLPTLEYPSYKDLTRLIGLSGFPMVTAWNVRLDDPEAVYIFCGPEGIPNLAGAKARCIFWQFEMLGDYAEQPNRHTAAEVWCSDPGWCARNGAKFVLMGSDYRLSFGARPALIDEYDLTMLAYMTPRRQAIRDALGDLRWPEHYPGHDTARRHNVLLSSRFMLAVHQHTPYLHPDVRCLAPIRLALAAAYHLPVICEAVADAGPYKDAVYVWADYEGIAGVARGFVEGKIQSGKDRAALSKLLCEEWTFKRCVEEALK